MRTLLCHIFGILSVSVIHSQTIVLSTRFAAKKGFGALNDTTGTCKTAANHVDHASGGNQRPTGSHGTECGTNALDTMSESGQFERRERTQLLSGAINRLSSRFRRTILLRIVEERSLEETAQVPSISTAAVKSRLFHRRGSCVDP